jgi:RNA recognition motif-containing protein
LIYTLLLVVFNVPPAKIIMDRKTGMPRGFGFVTFATAEEASAALETMNLAIKAMKNQVLFDWLNYSFGRFTF